jgi:uncharacterized membrane protein
MTVDRVGRSALHPLHEVLLAATVTLFASALASDVAYASSYEVQWTNFAAWLIAGGLLVGGLALAMALVGLRRSERRGGAYVLYCLLLLATWVLGFINALVHAKDAWASMPAGLVLSVVVTVLACLATWLGFSRLRARQAP